MEVRPWKSTHDYSTARVLSQRPEQCALSKGGSAVRSPRQMVRSPSSTRSSRTRSGWSPAWGWPVDDDQVLVGHVTDQDADDAERKIEVGGDLGDGQDVAAEGADGLLLHGQLRRLLPSRDGGDQRLDLQSVVGGPGPPAVMA